MKASSSSLLREDGQPARKYSLARRIFIALLPIAIVSLVAVTFLTRNGGSFGASSRMRTYDAGPSLIVSSNTVTSGTWVTVSWGNVPTDAITKGSGDYICDQDSHCHTALEVNLWVGAFVEGADLTPIGPQDWPCGNPPWLATAPIMWKPLTTVLGKTSFYLEAARHNIQFHLFGNGTTYPEYLASSSLVRFKDIHQPHHVHLALTSDPTEMRVMWQSAHLDDAMVLWGTEPGVYSFNATAQPITYNRADLCGPPATTHGWVDPGFFYTARIVGIEEGQVIYYSVGSNKYGWSKESHFKGPKHPNPDSTLRIIAIADVGETYIDGSQYHWMEPYAINTTNNIITAWTEHELPDEMRRFALNPLGRAGIDSGRTQPPRGTILSSTANRIRDPLDTTDVLVHIGDISYATGYETEWDRFMAQIEPIASRIPYMTGLGNHERDFPFSGDMWGGFDSGGECGIPTMSRFIMPTPTHNQGSGWYSFSQGPVHFIMMNTEMRFGPGSDQYAFFEANLALVNRELTPWVIFMGHRPMYYANILDPNFASFEPLLYKYKVDLCLWGHEHNAQVTCPVYQGKCVTNKDVTGYDAPVHAVIGNGGQSLTPFPEERADWSVYQAKEFGYSTIEVKGRQYLHMQFFEDVTNSLHYEIVLHRTRGGRATADVQSPQQASQ